MPRLLPLALVAAGLHGASAFATDAPLRFRCPDVAGLYRVVGEDPTLRESLQSLGFGMQGTHGSQLVFTSGPDGTLGAALRGNDPGHALEFSSQYSCVDGWLVFRQPLKARRGSHVGESKVRLKRADARLEIEVVFTGRKWLTLFSYDSAYLGVPLPFTGTTIKATLQWPVDRMPDHLVDPAHPPPERTDLVAARNLLNGAMLQGISLTGMESRGNGVLVHLRTPSENDVRAFEQRLRAASIAYEMTRAPVSADRFWYFDIMVWPQRSAQRH